ncbi:MAG: DUF2878 domain-containing protein [Planctomycetota bacterium]
MIRVLLNVGGFYVGWFGCVLGAAHGRPLTGAATMIAVIALHFALVRDRRTEAVQLAVITGAGTIIDSGMLLGGAWRFGGASDLTPTYLLWIAALWANFAVALSGSLRWLARWPLLAVVLGAISAPATYYGGAKLGALSLHPEPWRSLLALAIVWAIVLPMAAVWIVRRAAPAPQAVTP